MKYKQTNKVLLGVLVAALSACGGGGGDSKDTGDTGGGDVVTPTGSVSVSALRGNTATYNAIAEFDVSLASQPTADVIVPLQSDDSSEGIVLESQLTFTSSNWEEPQTVQVKGRNDGDTSAQDYQILLNALQSGDSNFDTVNPADVQILGLSFSIAAPESIPSFIEGVETTYFNQVTYSGNQSLSYGLGESPIDMNIDFNSGEISWTPPDAAEGTHSVTVVVTDGISAAPKSVTYSVTVIKPAATQIVAGGATSITGTSNLSGLSFADGTASKSARKTGQRPNPLATLTIETVAESALKEIPVYIDRHTDFFIVREAISGDLTITLPISAIPANTDLNKVKLYSLTRADGYLEEFWSSVATDVVVSADSVQVTLAGIEGVFFVGVENDLEEDSTSSRPAISHRLQAKVSVLDPVALTADISCSAVSANFNKQLCTTSMTGKEAVKITVLGFGDSANSTHWGGSTIKEMISWLIDTQTKMTALGMTYHDEFTVSVEKMRYGVLGYVTTGNNEDRNTLHLSSSPYWSKIDMTDTTSHEYFHHAQAKSDDSLTDVNKKLLMDGYRAVSWFIEGTASWIGDEVYDANDSYTNEPGRRILDVGLNAYYNTGRGAERPYIRYSVYKMMADKCTGFYSVFRNLLNIDSTSEITGAVNLDTVLQTADAGCNFGDHLGSAKKSTLEAALLYYQYATVFKNKMSLVESDEADNITFSTVKFSLSSDDILTDAQTGNRKPLTLHQITEIPAFGAVSFKVDQSFWSGIDTTSKDGVLKVSLDSGSSPITVSILSEDAAFTGNSVIVGAGGAETQHRHYQTDEKTEQILSSNNLVPLFVTLLNPNESAVAVSEVNISIRDSYQANLETVTIEGNPAADKTDVNKRVASISGSVIGDTANARDLVDVVVISNGSIQMQAPVDATTHQFTAQIITLMGSNSVFVQGYSSADMSNPLTYETAINFEGIEGTGVNALKPSQIALVLRWNKNNDLDLYSGQIADVTVDNTTTNNVCSAYNAGKAAVESNDCSANATPGNLDFDSESYGPEVITYELDANSAAGYYDNALFDADVHYFGQSSTGTPYSGATDYSIDVILNEMDANNRKIRHFDSVVALTNSTGDNKVGVSNGGVSTAAGDSRFNHLFSVSCKDDYQSRDNQGNKIDITICSMAGVDTGKLTSSKK